MKARILSSQVMAVLLVIVIALNESYWEKNSPIIEMTIFLLGTVLIGIGSMGRIWCSIYIAGYKNQSLITQGPYSISRNPLYFFSLLGAVGAGCITETFSFPILIFILFVISYPSTIKKEELKLAGLYKNAFSDYVKSTPQIIPNWSLLNEPKEYVIKPQLVKRHIFDALWFVWLIGVFEFLEMLHEEHIIPIYFNLF